MPTDYPRVSPVSAVLLRANNDRNGNPRRVFAVINHRGHVETLEEGYHGDALLRARWPWFDHRECDARGLVPAYYVSVDTTPAEVARLIRRHEYEREQRPEHHNPYTVDMLAAADRRERRHAATSAVAELARHEVHVHRHDVHRSAKLRALRRVAGVHEADHGHVATFTLQA